MNLLFQSTESFEKDIQQFDAPIREAIVERVNQIGQAFLHNRRAFAQQVCKPRGIKPGNGYDSSLYSVKVEPDMRIVLTADDDPLFEQAIVTLIRIVRSADLQAAYRAAADALYGSLNGHKTIGEVKVGPDQGTA